MILHQNHFPIPRTVFQHSLTSNEVSGHILVLFFLQSLADSRVLCCQYFLNLSSSHTRKFLSSVVLRFLTVCQNVISFFTLVHFVMSTFFLLTLRKVNLTILMPHENLNELSSKKDYLKICIRSSEVTFSFTAMKQLRMITEQLLIN